MMALPAAAQSNLGVTGGFLIPIGDFNDVTDPSPYLGARFELQDVNVLGEVAVVTVLVELGFAFLQTDSDLEDALKEAAGEDVSIDDGSYFDIGLGTRMYSAVTPFFVGAGAAYVNLDPPGPADSSSGFDIHAGLGLVFDTASVKFDIEGRGTIVFIEDDSVNHFQVLASVGIPFE
jgi:hypothetical protein